MDGRQHEVTPASVPYVDPVNHPLVEPPEDLSERRKGLWRQWAPMAIHEGTLIESRVLGFRELIAQLDHLGNLDVLVQTTSGRDRQDALRDYIKLAQRTDSSMARYRLTSNGRVEAAAKPKPKANPWGAVGGAAAR